MKEYNGLGLTPLFYSEITSSYMLYDIFKSHDNIISQLIGETFNAVPEKIIVERERTYPKKGSIDIFIEFMNSGKKCALLIEVKVHDYLSATDGQIATYYNAVIEDSVYDEVYFIYLTQFTEETDFNGIVTPKTIDEARKGKDLIRNRFLHISWGQMHMFLKNHFELLTEEQRLIASLNKQWVLKQSELDLESNKIDVGERGIEEYFFDVKTDIRKS
ncbi:MAG: PD-(D/E)XK nuclease family protein [Clostridiales bacterium]|nr:PD-(D/E)XK nuclease family protein [Clostridiales bacterium]